MSARDDYPNLASLAESALQYTEALDEIDRLRAVEQYVARYSPIVSRVTWSMHPLHYCMVCSDGTSPGPGCINCRDSGYDQTPCLACGRAETVRDMPSYGAPWGYAGEDPVEP